MKISSAVNIYDPITTNSIKMHMYFVPCLFIICLSCLFLSLNLSDLQFAIFAILKGSAVRNFSQNIQVHSQDQFVGVGPPKSGLFEPHSFDSPTETHFMAKSGPFGRFGGGVYILCTHPCYGHENIIWGLLYSISTTNAHFSKWLCRHFLHTFIFIKSVPFIIMHFLRCLCNCLYQVCVYIKVVISFREQLFILFRMCYKQLIQGPIILNATVHTDTSSNRCCIQFLQLIGISVHKASSKLVKENAWRVTGYPLLEPIIMENFYHYQMILGYTSLSLTMCMYQFQMCSIREHLNANNNVLQ